MKLYVYDRNVKYNDSSDILLMNTINRELRQIIIDTFLCIINDIDMFIQLNLGIFDVTPSPSGNEDRKENYV